MRTVVGGDSGYCRQTGQLPGFGAQWGDREKNKKWKGRFTRQVDQFIPLVREAGGTIGAPALEFLNTLAAAEAGSQSSECDAFMTFALQRLRLETFRGVTADPQRAGRLEKRGGLVCTVYIIQSTKDTNKECWGSGKCDSG